MRLQFRRKGLAYIFLCSCNTRSVPARWLRYFFTNICMYMPKIANLVCVGESFFCSSNLLSASLPLMIDDVFIVACLCKDDLFLFNFVLNIKKTYSFGLLYRFCSKNLNIIIVIIIFLLLLLLQLLSLIIILLY